MSLLSEISRKQERTIGRCIDAIFTADAFTSPKIKADFSALGFITMMKVGDHERILSKVGLSAVNRISEVIEHSKKYTSLLSRSDISQSVRAELERWADMKIIPNAQEFLPPLELVLEQLIGQFHYVCRIDGVELKTIDHITIGSKTIKPYCETGVKHIEDKHKILDSVIANEYGGCPVICGTEHGSDDIAIEKFYYNAELSLSILRLYSCALNGIAIQKINIRLINNCAQAYGPASCFGWETTQRSIIFKRYYKATQDFQIDKELLAQLERDYLFTDIAILIDKPDRSELEEAIVKSVYWVGEAQKDSSSPSAWIKLWSALECFFSIKDDEITESNARGIAAILIYGGFSHEGYKDYENVKRKIKRYYKARSKIVHRAAHTHIETAQLNELAYITAWVVLVMADLMKRGYSTLAEVGEQSARLDRTSLTSCEEN